MTEPRVPDAPGAAAAFPDLRIPETLAVVPLLALAVAIGIAPRVLLDIIDPASRTLIDLVAR